MIIYGIPLNDIVTVVSIALTGVLWLVNRFSAKLPKDAKIWLDKIGYDTIEGLVSDAARIATMTAAERRHLVVDQIRRVLPIPTSVANLLVEYVYQKTMKK